LWTTRQIRRHKSTKKSEYYLGKRNFGKWAANEVICLADEGYESAGSGDPGHRTGEYDGEYKGAQAMNRQFGVENVFSGEYDRVAVSTTFRQQSPSTGNKSKKGAKDSVFKE
jgi:hypothetical protein